MELITALDTSIARATSALLAAQKQDGHWVFELESDVSSAADYVLIVHYLGEEPDNDLERKIALYIRRTQLQDGGWPLATDGTIDVSVSVKAYFALKMSGDSPDSEHMIRAKQAIIAAGGAEASNGLTRVLLAVYGEITWCAIPMMPVEFMLLPKWFPFHLSNMSCFARLFIVPLLVLNAKRPVAQNPRGIGVRELFSRAPNSIGLLPRLPNQSRGWYWFFLALDLVLRFVDPLVPKFLRKRAIDEAVTFVEERLTDEQGLGGLFPTTANAVLMYNALGYPSDYPGFQKARRSLEKQLLLVDNEVHCQLTQLPVWDTALAVHALLETSDQRAETAACRGLDWALPRQILDVRGDWALHRPNLRPGGWAFQNSNPHYPEVDDTVVVIMAMHSAETRNGSSKYAESINRGREWILGMQSSDGGWSPCDPDTSYSFFNNIPFFDNGVLVDSTTSDISARCLSMLSQFRGSPEKDKISDKACQFLLRKQEKNGSWFGRHGMNYIWGTWSALCALNAAGLSHEDARIQRAVDWLVSIQNDDGGWGEDASSYKLDYCGHEPAPSTASQTSWALLGLMAAGEVNHPAVTRGIAWLMETQSEDGTWEETAFTGTGCPHILYFRYHGYPKYFPLWALARYRNLKCSGVTKVTTVI